ncbi:Cfr10I/Bse634I family restriction endonuclease [Sulfobacillus sp. hq2]|uniref:Cfr10I/Bse634I family restriction endonuclease n=1 Tax=Sulfobacillus TaxID=28033 RepID=UPI000CD10652|nr:Cfr10I/Bse634I family restriction endonuclease [Sulfobacillus sp. hq2]POB09670.1 hypothetical protein CO251_15820 [Sulfobacillus sp. hq2]
MNLTFSEAFILNSATGKGQIVPSHALDDLYGASLPQLPIVATLEQLTKHISDVANAKGLALPSREALSNARGTWFETLVVASAWNYIINLGITDTLVVQLPNVQRFDFRNLFDQSSQSMLDDLERSLRRHEVDVEMVTSNPDLIVIKSKDMLSRLAPRKIANLSLANQHYLSGFYENLRTKCPWDSIVAGIGLKTSVRPDRRLQLVHEGNILKSTFAHLKMRHWNRDFRFLYVVASSEKFNDADKKALKTAATHTIVNVDATPERSVDELYWLTEFEDVERMLGDVITTINR